MTIHLDSALTQLASETHQAGKSLVLVTGVFDVLHEEHRHFLEAAKAAGDILIVGIESDKRVKEIKGPDRPVNDQLARQKNLEQWLIADRVFILSENFGQKEQREGLIEVLRPDVLAVSSHTKHQEEKAAVVEHFGGQLKVVYEHHPEISSTKLIGDHQKQ